MSEAIIHAPDSIAPELCDKVIGFRYLAEPLRTAPFTALGTTAALSLTIPERRPDLIVRCKAFGVGTRCARIVSSLTSIEWFSHLVSSLKREISSCEGYPDQELQRLNDGNLTKCHVASIAIDEQPSDTEVDYIVSLSDQLRKLGAFVIVTTSNDNPATLARIGLCCDCIVGGVGDAQHHFYPIRAVSWPKEGRMICYDLFDVLSIWAGRIGSHRSMFIHADATHLETSTRLDSVRRVDDAVQAASLALGGKPFQLVTVVDGLDSEETVPTSSKTSTIVNQSRAPQGGRM